VKQRRSIALPAQDGLLQSYGAVVFNGSALEDSARGQ
jgi:hypothetical protein